MSSRSLVAIAVAMTAVAVAVRVHNALTFPILGGYDAFAHFTYVWFVAETGRVPLARSGWEFFQPPLYYAAMAALWRAFDGLGAEQRLRIGTTAFALLSLVPAAVAARIASCSFPARPVTWLLAGGLLLFIPVHLYSAAFLGNEGLACVLCSVAALALLAVLDRATMFRALSLGVVLGLAMLAKYTAVVLVAAALATIAAKRLFADRTFAAVRTLAIVSASMLAVCGWHYARNVRNYGTPFPLSRDELFLARVENGQLQAFRRPLEYVLFDPLILYRPQWPRGLSMHSPRPPGAEYSAMRESIPTGLYANAWFDGSGGFVLPPVTHSEASRRAGQLLLTLALVPTLLIAVGLLASVTDLRREGWRDDRAVMLAMSATMAAVLVAGTLSVPTQAAVKATYLMVISVAFAFFFARGFVALAERSGRMAMAAIVTCTTLAAVSSAVFCHAAFIDDAWFRQALETARVRNLYGILDWAAGHRDAAAEKFGAAAAAGWHLGYENLAACRLASGDTEAAEYFLREAARRMPGQLPGNMEERRRGIATTQAEYDNALGAVLMARGRSDDAQAALRRSIAEDPTIPESAYNLAVAELAVADGANADPGPSTRDAVSRLDASLALDPAFTEASSLRPLALALAGRCDEAEALSANAGLTHCRPLRAWPVETGPGDLNAAGLLRHRRVEPLPAALAPARVAEVCRRAGPAPAR
ncbi:MAG TPA: hypothetical protein VGK20_18595 [Candidatus Binatia bacterium]|jgi:tetratricopeptide (TPR) repeat protein